MQEMEIMGLHENELIEAASYMWIKGEKVSVTLSYPVKISG